MASHPSPEHVFRRSARFGLATVGGSVNSIDDGDDDHRHNVLLYDVAGSNKHTRRFDTVSQCVNMTGRTATELT